MTRTGNQQNVRYAKVLQQRPGVLSVLTGRAAFRFQQQRRFGNAEGFELLAGKVMGTPVNLKFRDLFTVEKMTILGEPTESLKETIAVMNPVIKPYTGGLN